MEGCLTHKYFRDVYFKVTSTLHKSSNRICMLGWWIRKDFGSGELVLAHDAFDLNYPLSLNWTFIPDSNVNENPTD